MSSKFTTNSMNHIDLIISIAERLNNLIKQQHQVYYMSTEDFGWTNYRYRSPKFRLAHIEIFNQDKFCVVHCCVFPHKNDPAPIYGFDVIAGENKITGVFLDLSPVALPCAPFTDIVVERERERPEWGDIFSPHWLACRPSYEEMTKIGDEAIRVLTVYLSDLGDVGVQRDIITAQNHYCRQQQRNPHTKRALVNLLGEERADYFMQTILFPTI